MISYDENKDVLYKIELFDELQNEVAETRTDNERLQQVIIDRDEELADSSEAIRRLQTERESLKRQLEDLQSTLEFQEAKMDRGSGKSSSERRSLRRKKSSVGSRPPMSPTSPDPGLVRFFLKIISFFTSKRTKGNFFDMISMVSYDFLNMSIID